MKAFLVVCYLFLSVNTSFAANKNNWRCWADPGFFGVIKIDTEKMKVCSTGYDGQNYECADSQRILNLSSIERSEVTAGGQKFPATLYKALSDDGKTSASLTILDEEFPRPYFSNYQVSPANIEISTGLLGYPSYSWSRKPDGLFPDGDFYCLSEKYFIP